MRTTAIESTTQPSVAVTGRLRDEAGVRFGLAHGWLIAAALFAGATHMPEALSLTVVAVTAVASGRGLAVHQRAGVGLAAWAIWTGFLANSLGVLTWSGPDLARLTTLILLTVVRLGP
ncbi:MAG: hypothetical protein ABWX73_15640 [Marmoricola sp.]